jgi:murein DD-endopeptidase MepM/ murein hydrolase activator NlpD
MYFHLAQARIHEGDKIAKGDILGFVGSTGRSTGPHLHWGIRIRDARIDPFSLIRVTKNMFE